MALVVGLSTYALAPSQVSALDAPTFSAMSVGVQIVTRLPIDGVDKVVIINGSNYDGAVVETNVPGSSYTLLDSTRIELVLPTAGMTQDFSVSVTVTNSDELSATFDDVLQLVIPRPPEITVATFSAEGANRKELTLNGTDFPDSSNVLSRSLIALNGVMIPFCTTNVGVTAATFVGSLNVDPSIVSDEPTCYFLVDEGGNVAITDTRMVIWLNNDFDMTATGTVSVDGGPEYVLNQPLSGGDDEDTTDQSGSGSNSGNSGTGQSNSQKAKTPSVAEPAPIVETQPADKTTTVTITTGGDALVDQSVIRRSPTFSGTAAPYSIVVVTVHSDPVTCTTKADEFGRWTCTLADSIPAGNHTVNVTVTAPDGTVTELGPYDVVVEETEQTQLSGNISPESSVPIVGISIVTGVVIIGSIIGLVVRARRIRP